MTSASQLELQHGDEALRRAGIRDHQAALARFAAKALSVGDGIGVDTYNPYGLRDSAINLVAELTDEQAVALVGASPTVDRWKVRGVSKHNSDVQNARARLAYLAERIIVADWRDLAAHEEPLPD